MMNLIDDKSDGNEFSSLSVDYQHQQGDQLNISTPSKASTSSRLLYSVYINNAVFGTTASSLQSIAMKAVNSYDYGYPKLKHMNILRQYVEASPQKFDDILITFHALTNWKNSKIVSCKILIVILVLMQRGPPIDSLVIPSLSQFLIIMREYWLPVDNYLHQFSMILHQRLLFLNDHHEYSDHFNISKMSYNGLSLPSFDNISILSILSRLLSIQNNLINLLHVTIKYNLYHPHSYSSSSSNSNSTNTNNNNHNLTKNEKLTYQSSLTILFEEANCIYIANYHMLLCIYKDNNSIFTNTVTITLREQFDEQFNSLRFIYCDLMNTDVNNKQYLGRFPESNPLLHKSINNNGIITMAMKRGST